VVERADVVLLPLYSADAAATLAINGPAGLFKPFDTAVVGMSSMGLPVLIALVAIQWWLPSGRYRDRHVLFSAGLSFLMGLGLNQVILLFIHRVRPYDAGITHLIIEKSADFSFPSDHATAVFAITFLAHGLWQRGIWFLIAAILISLSRVYIGTHYVSDILGGALTGSVAAVAISVFFSRTSRFSLILSKIM
jgi:undecaprenyl-diphosphatase